eukprot:6176080-Amphidinium_carterae.2
MTPAKISLPKAKHHMRRVDVHEIGHQGVGRSGAPSRFVSWMLMLQLLRSSFMTRSRYTWQLMWVDSTPIVSLVSHHSDLVLAHGLFRRCAAVHMHVSPTATPYPSNHKP